MPGYRTVTVAAIVAGLSFGALSAIGRAHLDGTLDAFVNSTSTWLVAPFLVGSLAATRRGAAAAGFGTCVAQLVGYYVVADLRGGGTAASLVAFWTACGVVGGPLFGMAGRLWRTSAPRHRGLGVAVLAGVFVAEGLYAYWHQQRDYVTGALWIGIGAALAVVSSGARVSQLRWLGLTVSLGVAGEVVLTAALRRFF
jgi:hypothetical protein